MNIKTSCRATGAGKKEHILYRIFLSLSTSKAVCDDRVKQWLSLWEELGVDQKGTWGNLPVSFMLKK